MELIKKIELEKQWVCAQYIAAKDIKENILKRYSEGGFEDIEYFNTSPVFKVYADIFNTDDGYVMEVDESKLKPLTKKTKKKYVTKLKQDLIELEEEKNKKIALLDKLSLFYIGALVKSLKTGATGIVRNLFINGDSLAQAWVEWDYLIVDNLHYPELIEYLEFAQEPPTCQSLRRYNNGKCLKNDKQTVFIVEYKISNKGLTNYGIKD